MPMRRPDRPFHTLELAHQNPDWRRLPEEVRETATRLMARMLCERKTRTALDHAAGGRDDE